MRDFHREIFFLDFFVFTNHFLYGIYAKIFFHFFIYPVFGGVKMTTPSKPGANAALTANPGSKRLIIFTHRFFYSDFLHGLDWRRWPGWPSNLCMTELSFALIPSLFIKFLFIVERGSHVISAHQHFLPLAHCGRITKSNMKIGDFHVVFFYVPTMQ